MTGRIKTPLEGPISGANAPRLAAILPVNGIIHGHDHPKAARIGATLMAA